MMINCEKNMYGQSVDVTQYQAETCALWDRGRFIFIANTTLLQTDSSLLRLKSLVTKKFSCVPLRVELSI